MILLAITGPMARRIPDPIPHTESVVDWLIGHREQVSAGALVALGIVALMLVARFVGRRMVEREHMAERIGWRTVIGRVLVSAHGKSRKLVLRGEIASPPRSPVATTLLALTGLLFATHAVRLFARFALAYRRPAELVISARVVGDGTQRLTRLRPGTRVLVEGPHGRMTGDNRKHRKLLFIGAGAGVGPLVSLLESEPYERGDAIIVTRDSSRHAALRSDAIRNLVAQRGVRHVALNGPRSTTGPGWLPATHSGWRGADVFRFLAPFFERIERGFEWINVPPARLFWAYRSEPAE